VEAQEKAASRAIPDELLDTVGETFTMSAADFFKYKEATVKRLQVEEAMRPEKSARVRGKPRGRVLLVSRFHDPSGERYHHTAPQRERERERERGRVLLVSRFHDPSGERYHSTALRSHYHMHPYRAGEAYASAVEACLTPAHCATLRSSPHPHDASPGSFISSFISSFIHPDSPGPFISSFILSFPAVRACTGDTLGEESPFASHAALNRELLKEGLAGHHGWSR
jgi:hypothetical protein